MMETSDTVLQKGLYTILIKLQKRQYQWRNKIILFLCLILVVSSHHILINILFILLRLRVTQKALQFPLFSTFSFSLQ